MIDHTLQIGATKLFVIVGVLLDEVPFAVRSLQLADLHLVAMLPMKEANQESVKDELKKAISRTGVPRQIVADGAGELQKGIELFQKDHPQTTAVPDAPHHAANLLKHYWQRDPRWLAFTRQINETAKAIRQTDSAYMLAPTLRNKMRYMSVGKFVRFGRILLRKLQEPQPSDELVRRYGWVREYGDDLAAWSEQYTLVEAMVRQVRLEGLFTRGEAELEQQWERLGVNASIHPVSVALRHRLRAYVSRHGRQLPVGERLVGSTEVLESAFGVQKRLSRDQVSSGLTALSLGLGALVGKTTVEQIASEMDRVPEKTVESWAKRTLGKTVQWMRRQFVQTPSPEAEARTKSGMNPQTQK